MEGSFRHYFANSKIRIQEIPQGSFIKTTLIGPFDEISDAVEKYFFAYPAEGYATKITYEGNIVNPKGGKERVVQFERYHSCD